MRNLIFSVCCGIAVVSIFSVSAKMIDFRSEVHTMQSAAPDWHAIKSDYDTNLYPAVK